MKHIHLKIITLVRKRVKETRQTNRAFRQILLILYNELFPLVSDQIEEGSRLLGVLVDLEASFEDSLEDGWVGELSDEEFYYGGVEALGEGEVVGFGEYLLEGGGVDVLVELLELWVVPEYLLQLFGVGRDLFFPESF